MNETIQQGIQLRNITKNYGHTCALRDISTVFLPETIYGLLGQNGAGKSTLLNLIANRQFASSGSISIDGQPAPENDAVLSRVFLMSDQALYPEDMRVRDIFKWSAAFYPDFDMDRAKELADQFKVNPRKKFKSLSTGYASIVKLIVSLCVNTPYLLLDEPVLGLDANNRDLFYRYLMEKYAKNPCTIVISTHLIEEIAHLIENVVILKEGAVIQDTSKDELLARGFTVSGKAADVEHYIETLGQLHAQDTLVLGTDSLGAFKTAYILGKRQDIPDTLEVGGMNLQKLFIQMTNAPQKEEVSHYAS